MLTTSPSELNGSLVVVWFIVFGVCIHGVFKAALLLLGVNHKPIAIVFALASVFMLSLSTLGQITISDVVLTLVLALLMLYLSQRLAGP